MKSRLLINLSLLLIAWQKAGAQLAPADDFFNGGAQLYISNNIPAALERVETGLKTYPNDDKLKRLEQLLKQQQQQQQQQQNQQKQDQQKKSDDQKNQQQNQQKDSQQQKPDQQKQNQADQQKDEQKEQQQKASVQKKDGEKPDQPDAEGQPVKPGEMTPAEAKRLLDAQKGDEQLLQMKPEGKPVNPNRPVKDW